MKHFALHFNLKKLSQMKKVHHNHEIFYIKYLIKKDYIKLKKNTPNAIVKYFTQNFYFKNVTLYSEKITCKTKNCASNNKTFTPNLIIFSPNQKHFTRNIKFFIPN